MEIKIKLPTKIEEKSFEIIKEELGTEKLNKIPLEMQDVIIRVIHSTADFDFYNTIKFSKNFYQNATKAILNGCNILTDIKMVKYGISEKMCNKLNIKVDTFINNDDVVELAQKEKITRSIAAMRLHGDFADNGLIVIGNAPTALFEVIELIKIKKIKPAAVIGVPVGFVGASESKEYLYNENIVPFITALGRKGGTPVAVAIVNALLKKCLKV